MYTTFFILYILYISMNYSSVYAQMKLKIHMTNYYFRRIKILSIILHIITPSFSHLVDSLNIHLILIKDETIYLLDLIFASANRCPNKIQYLFPIYVNPHSLMAPNISQTTLGKSLIPRILLVLCFDLILCFIIWI